MPAHSKLTDRTHRIILSALGSGCYRATACEYANVSPSAFYSWLERGQLDIERGLNTPHAKLVRDIEQAEAAAEVRALALIMKAAHNGAWQAAAWMLERKHPEKWGKRERLSIEPDSHLSVSFLPPGTNPVDLPASLRRQLAAFLDEQSDDESEN